MRSRFAAVWTALVLAILLATGTATAGPLAAVGDRLGDATVEAVEAHPEFQRYDVRLPDGRLLPLEVTVVRDGSSPACTRGELGVFPRWELLWEGPGPVQDDPAGALAREALCERLAAADVALDIALHEAPPQVGPGPDAPDAADAPAVPPSLEGTTSHPLQLVLVGLLLAAVLGLVGPEGRALRGWGRPAWLDLAIVGATSALARLVLSHRGLHIAPDAGYERLVLAWGVQDPHPLYGDGFASLHAPLQALTGFDPSGVFWLHLALSALAPVVLWVLARAVIADRAAALAAGLGLALLPTALRLAGSEVEHVPLATFELLAVAGAWGALRTGSPRLSMIGGLAAGFAAHLRPEALPFVLLPAGLLALTARRHLARERAWALVALGLLLGLAAWRVFGLPPLGQGGPVSASDLLGATYWLGLVLPSPLLSAAASEPHQTFLDLALTTPVLPILVVMGLIRWRRDAAPIALAWLALTLLPTFSKSWPQLDAWRLQLGAQAPLILLAAAGVAALPRTAWRWAAVVAVAGTSALYLPAVRARWAGQAEWDLLVRTVAELPPGATLLVPDHDKHGLQVRRVVALLASRAGSSDPDVRSMGGFAAAPDPGPDRFAWLGLTCRIARLPGFGVANDATVNPCLQLQQRCTLEPWLTEPLPTVTDLDLDLVDPPVEAGFYRVDDCRP